MFMIFLVLHDLKNTDAVLAEWTKAGVGGATLMDSTGAFRRRKRVPGRFVYANVDTEEINRSIFAIVASEELALAALAATERVVGDLSLPDTGVFSYWPLVAVKGVPKIYPGE